MSYPPYGAPQGAYPPQGGYPPQPGYPPAPGGQYYPPGPGYAQPGQIQMPDPYGNQGGYPPAAGGYPPVGFQPPPGQQQYGQQYPPQQTGSGYPPQQPPMGYPPAGAGYPGQAAPGAYPPAQGGYPPVQGGYPPAQGGYPPAQGAMPGQPGGYVPPGPAGYAPPGQAGYNPPPAGGYGQQPGMGGYAQPGGGYGAPAGGYGTPAMGAGGSHVPLPQGQGTVRPAARFDAEEDSKVLRKAMKGLGTDEKAIIDILSTRSNKQRQDIKNRFKTMYGKDLISDLKSELSGRFEDLVLALLQAPIEYDAEEMRHAMQGAGTDERALIEIMCTRTNQQINEIKAAYKLKFSRNLEKDLASETSGHFRRLLVSLSTGNRMENQPLDYAKAKQDAQELYQAGEKKIGTDESKFNQILCSQGYEQLRLVFQEYKTLSKKGLDQVIRSEMSGDLENGMIAIYTCVENRHKFFAERLYHSMKGAGTKDRTLIRIVTSRCEVDMVQIKQEFQRQFGQTLESFIEGDTSGDYRKLLLALIRG